VRKDAQDLRAEKQREVEDQRRVRSAFALEIANQLPATELPRRGGRASDARWILPPPPVFGAETSPARLISTVPCAANVVDQRGFAGTFYATR